MAKVGALARRRFFEGTPDAQDLETWGRLAFPVYTRTKRGPQAVQRGIRRADVNLWFARPGGEGRTFNFFPVLSRIQCPTLVLGGERSSACLLMTGAASKAADLGGERPLPSIAGFGRLAYPMRG